jgi:hypothetical protein
MVHINSFPTSATHLLIPHAHKSKLGIGIEETYAGVGIPASMTSIRYRNTKKLDCISLVRYLTCSGIASFFHSATGMTGCQTGRHSGISNRISRFSLKKLKYIIMNMTKRRLETS